MSQRTKEVKRGDHKGGCKRWDVFKQMLPLYVFVQIHNNVSCCDDACKLTNPFKMIIFMSILICILSEVVCTLYHF